MTSSRPSRPSPWWMPDRHADRRPALLARARIKSAIRAWFETQGFIEVEPGCLQVSPGNEAHLHAFRTEIAGTDLSRAPLYLHTSPEFAMKKLLAAGETKIFAFAPCFRNRETGFGADAGLHPLHAAEFTMLEWYRAGAPYEQLWDDCAALLKIAAHVTRLGQWPPRRAMQHPFVCDVAKPLDHITLDQAFSQFAEIELHETYDATSGDRDGLAARALAVGIQVGDGDSWADIFSRVLTEKIEPYLGLRRPAILSRYPASQAALARRVTGSPQHAERFELYCCGIELANGFGEQTDAAALRANLEAEMQLKFERYGERYPIDEEFLAAVEIMPASSGCALGFDRLVMLATGARSVDDVIWTPLTVPGT